MFEVQTYKPIWDMAELENLHYSVDANGRVDSSCHDGGFDADIVVVDVVSVLLFFVVVVGGGGGGGGVGGLDSNNRSGYGDRTGHIYMVLAVVLEDFDKNKMQ
ncbi:Hypothetical predicted protein [Octopus vulgaris]|uniref:Uncharacterized protein n=1 Tax=Octopus vulgaris TaxID=6645 RepID=A0AA36BE31_OCTVU|nr:Hypothetical predicted protein [Octopus vulgaris]